LVAIATPKYSAIRLYPLALLFLNALTSSGKIAESLHCLTNPSTLLAITFSRAICSSEVILPRRGSFSFL